MFNHDMRGDFMYSESDIYRMCDRAFENIRTFYQCDFVNYRGKTTDTHHLYTEVVAKYVLDNIDAFLNDIPQITRLKDYNQWHDGTFREGTGRDEEIIAIKMFRKSMIDNHVYSYIGKIIDYQTPLKSKRTDVAGKIDLLAYDGKTLRILELKKPTSTESMLRCVLEGYTYLKTVDSKKLLMDFELPSNTEIKAAPFVFYGESQWIEWQEDRPFLKQLCEKLATNPYFIKEENDSYIVLEEE